MTTNDLPSASGARLAGDRYQWLHVWRACMEALHHKVAPNTNNPIIAVGVEEPGVGNGDDVVRHRQHPPNTHTQVKYAVDHRTPAGLAWLDEKDILAKMVSTHQSLTAAGTPVELHLTTNRTIDPTDVLMRDLDGRDGRLLPRAAQGGPQSERGKARAEWARAAHTDEDTLMRFLADFHLEVGYEPKQLRREVGLLMTANGLRSDDAAIDQAVDWVSQEVIAGHRRLTLADITAAVTALELHTGSPWTPISIATITHDHLADHAAVSIDWVDRIAGDTDWTRIEPAPPHTWAELADDIKTLRAQLGDTHRILVGGHMRQATGFLVGAELRRVLGFQVGVRQGDQLWTGEESVEPVELNLTRETIGRGTETALIVTVADNAAGVTVDWIRRAELPVDTAIIATPASGAPYTVPSPAAANSLALAVRAAARRNAGATALHLFLIGPLGLAVLLGHHWNRITTTHVYEHLGGVDYVHAFTVDT